MAITGLIEATRNPVVPVEVSLGETARRVKTARGILSAIPEVEGVAGAREDLDLGLRRIRSVRVAQAIPAVIELLPTVVTLGASYLASHEQTMRFLTKNVPWRKLGLYPNDSRIDLGVKVASGLAVDLGPSLVRGAIVSWARARTGRDRPILAEGLGWTAEHALRWGLLTETMAGIPNVDYRQAVIAAGVVVGVGAASTVVKPVLRRVFRDTSWIEGLRADSLEIINRLRG